MIDSHPVPNVVVFAYNEEASIANCLDSIHRASTRPLRNVYVLANGCRDDTEGVVRRYAAGHPWVQLVAIEQGDKSNAWNVAVHEVLPAGEDCVFFDGDVRMEPGAIDALDRTLRENPDSNAAAAVPATGRSREQLHAYVTELRLLLGNLYALRGSFLDDTRRLGVRIPVGYIGEDCLVTNLVKWNLDPTGPFVDERIAPSPDARFSYRSFSPWRIGDWRTYWRRRVRYSLRHFQGELLGHQMRSRGIDLPGTVDDLYVREAERIPTLGPRSGLDRLFDGIALRRIRREIA